MNTQNNTKALEAIYTKSAMKKLWLYIKDLLELIFKSKDAF